MGNLKTKKRLKILNKVDITDYDKLKERDPKEILSIYEIPLVREKFVNCPYHHDKEASMSI